ncbi:hypothetical protein DV711_08145 [Motiliproteus coralliicola]|uniref:Uncharacterized protein n=1 Tax=Motiliproteus coralliicola TaxID=2283196 RepID=A0A369WMW0_9GAMM|nr:hypothetical protein [Motiliproteus coralliicola]RDE22553.1 hypothetical protein DV711_08145 [Motiliproteus coralliicola]
MFTKLFSSESFGLFSPKPLLEQDSALWLCQQFAWLMQQFGTDHPLHQAELVLPNNDYFPGKADSHRGMAQLLLERIKQYSGLQHWPTELVNLRAPTANAVSDQSPTAAQPSESVPASALPVAFDPAQVNDPQALISSLLQGLTHPLLLQRPTPVGLQQGQWPLLVELLGIYLGFGIPITNSAFAFAGGCGSCASRAAQRQAYLSQDEALFALVIFCELKGIGCGQVTTHLKPHLKPFYKRARQQLLAMDEFQPLLQKIAS